MIRQNKTSDMPTFLNAVKTVLQHVFNNHQYYGYLFLEKMAEIKNSTINLARVKYPVLQSFTVNDPPAVLSGRDFIVQYKPSSASEFTSLTLVESGYNTLSKTEKIEWPNLRTDRDYVDIKIKKIKGYDIESDELQSSSSPEDSVFLGRLDTPKEDIAINCTALPLKRVIFIDLTQGSMRHTRIDTAVKEFCEKREYQDVFLFLTNGSAWKPGQNESEIHSVLNDLYTLAPSVGNIFTDVKEMASCYKSSQIYSPRYYTEYHLILTPANTGWIDRRLEQFETAISQLSLAPGEKVIIHTDADITSFRNIGADAQYEIINELIFE